MIDHETEDLIPFETSGQRIPGRPSRCTLFRWALKGINGVKLETLICGHKRFTSEAAIARFIAAQNADQSPAPTITPTQRRRQAETADRLLQEAGLRPAFRPPHQRRNPHPPGKRNAGRRKESTCPTITDFRWRQ